MIAALSESATGSLDERDAMLRELSRQKDLAEAATSAKAQFLANVSHEIRTPMNGVMGMLEILSGTALSDDQRDLVETAQSSASGLLTLIDDLLHFSKIEAGYVEIESTTFSVRECFDECIDVVRLRAHAKGLRLYLDIDPSVPRIVRGDSGKVRQVAMNLLNNAIEFTTEGSICLRAGYDAGTRMLAAEVADTGVGIPSSRVKKIFEAFAQGDSSTTRQSGGTGLGLSISRSLATALGGELSVESTVGSGSTFRFTAELPTVEKSYRNPLDGVVVHYRIADPIEEKNLESILLALGCRGQRRSRDDLSALDDLSIAIVDADQHPGAPRGRTLLVGRRDEGSKTRPVLVTPLSLRSVRRALQQWQPRSKTSAHAVNGPPIRSLSILVAEDNVVNQKVITRLLERAGHRITVANDGVEAVTAVRSTRFDVVFMDCQMPRMSGFEAARRIRALGAAGERVPIIALTANVGDVDRLACFDAGMDWFVAKPIRPSELQETLAAVAAAISTDIAPDEGLVP